MYVCVRVCVCVCTWGCVHVGMHMYIHIHSHDSTLPTCGEAYSEHGNTALHPIQQMNIETESASVPRSDR